MSTDETTIRFGCGSIFTWLLGIPTAIIGYEIHGSIFWSVIDLLFYPIVWAKWLICQEVNMTIIKNAFSFFLQ